MSDLVERLRAHVNNRGGASLQNGAWQMMLDAADKIEKLQRRVTVLEMVIQEELDEFDCCDEANRMIVENIHERGASVALPSEERNSG